MIWNEPNNKSHLGSRQFDPDWSVYRRSREARRRRPSTRPIPTCAARTGRDVTDRSVLGEPHAWARRSRSRRCRCGPWFPARLEPVADPRHGPTKIAEIEAACPDKPIWVTEVGVGSFGAEEVQVFGVNRTAELLIGRVPRIFWYSLYDLPQEWGATTRHREAEGIELLSPLLHGPDPRGRHAEAQRWTTTRRSLARWVLCSGSTYEDPRLDDAVAWMKRLGTQASCVRGYRGRTASAPTPSIGSICQMEALAGLRRDGHLLLHAQSTSVPARTTQARLSRRKGSPTSAGR